MINASPGVEASKRARRDAEYCSWLITLIKLALKARKASDAKTP